MVVKGALIGLDYWDWIEFLYNTTNKVYWIDRVYSTSPWISKNANPIESIESIQSKSKYGMSINPIQLILLIATNKRILF
jgi:hypothetical protein